MNLPSARHGPPVKDVDPARSVAQIYEAARREAQESGLFPEQARQHAQVVALQHLADVLARLMSDADERVQTVEAQWEK